MAPQLTNKASFTGFVLSRQQNNITSPLPAHPRSAGLLHGWIAPPFRYRPSIITHQHRLSRPPETHSEAPSLGDRLQRHGGTPESCIEAISSALELSTSNKALSPLTNGSWRRPSRNALNPRYRNPRKS